MRATIRCYAELNDFLPRERRQVAFDQGWDGRVSVKDLLEGLGVPHGEVDLLLVNGESSGFDRLVEDGDRVAAYPVFESFDIASETKVRPEPLRQTRFVRYDDDRRCTGCGRIYWKGTHYERLGRLLDAALRGRDA